MSSPFQYDASGTIVKLPERAPKPAKAKKAAVAKIETPVATRPAPAPAIPKNLSASPHLLDLTPYIGVVKRREDEEVESIKPAKERRPFFVDTSLQRDFDARSISVRPKGWYDFPPPEARTLGQAVLITLGRVFKNHPLSELTVAALVRVGLGAVAQVGGRPLAAITRTARIVGAKLRLPPLPIWLQFKSVQAFVKTKTTDTVLPIKKTSIKSKKKFFKFTLPTYRPTNLPALIAIAVLLILPTAVAIDLLTGRNEIETNALNGFRSLAVAGDSAKSRDFVDASFSFTRAAAEFADARERLGAIGTLLASAAELVPARNRFAAANPALTAGREIALGGSILSNGLAMLDESREPIAKIEALRAAVEAALPHVETAAAEIAKIDADQVPASFRTQFIAARDEAPRLAALLRQAAAVTGLLPAIAGANGPKRYLVVFQNSAELRPTGGFIGSFALLDVDRGEVKSVEIPGGGSYDLQGSLKLNLPAPQPLRLINPKWEFQDANWSPDFPTAARTLTRFYESSGGPTTDGVIALNETLIERLLAVVGPVALTAYGKTIDAANFYPEIQKHVEFDYDRAANRPKQILADLAPLLLTKVLAADRETSLRLASTLSAAVAAKEVQFWFRDAALQTRIDELGWSGALKPAEGDYLAVVHANIAGQKTDAVMTETVEHAAKILADGSSIVTLTVKRTHGGRKGELFSGVRNVDYLRVYVPAGSELIEARGFERPDPKLFKIPAADLAGDPAVGAPHRPSSTDRASGTEVWTEAGKTVFGNWVQTDPGETSLVNLTYRLPAGTVRRLATDRGRLSDLYRRLRGPEPTTLAYSLLVQKQSGLAPVEFVSRVEMPRGARPVWQSPTTADGTTAAVLNGDAFFGAIAELP